MEEKNNDLTQIIAQILNEIKQELGSDFDFEKINLAELERRSGISRAKLRRLKANGFVDAPHSTLLIEVLSSDIFVARK